MALSPKQMAAKAVFHNLSKFIELCKDSVPDFAEGRKNLVKEQKAAEMVDKIVSPLVIKIERLCKRKLGKSVADQIEEQDKADKADF